MPRRKYAWETLSDEQLLKRRLSSLRVTVEGTWLEDCVRRSPRRARRAGYPAAAPRLDIERVVQSGQARLALPSLSISPIPA